MVLWVLLAESGDHQSLSEGAICFAIFVEDICCGVGRSSRRFGREMAWASGDVDEVVIGRHLVFFPGFLKLN
jgi:hypothetical protein